MSYLDKLLEGVEQLLMINDKGLRVNDKLI